MEAARYTEMPNSLSQSAVPSLPAGLEILDLSSNCIRELPDALGDLAALRELNASGNAIEELPGGQHDERSGGASARVRLRQCPPAQLL